MSKDPAFLFYPGDWLGGTIGMTFEEKGAYMDLLMLQFNRGHMTSHMAGQVVGQLWVTLQVKFIQDKDGLWFNERLEMEINKRKKFVSSRNNNLEGRNQYNKDKGHMDGHMTSHMENENENVNTSSSLTIYNAEILLKEMLNSDNWKTGVLNSGYVVGMDMIGLDTAIKRFVNEQKDKGNLSKTLRQYREHFINWLKIQSERKTIPVKTAYKTPQPTT